MEKTQFIKFINLIKNQQKMLYNSMEGILGDFIIEFIENLINTEIDLLSYYFDDYNSGYIDAYLFNISNKPIRVENGLTIDTPEDLYYYLLYKNKN